MRVGNVTRKQGIAGRDVRRSHQAMQHDMLSLTGKAHPAGARNDEIAIGENIGNQHGRSRRDRLGVTYLSATGEITGATQIDGG